MIKNIKSTIKYNLRVILSKLINKRLYIEHFDKGDLTVGLDVEGIDNVQFGGNNYIGSRSYFTKEIIVGKKTTIGKNNYWHGPIEVGNYCQIGPYVAIYSQDHPITHTSTYISRNLFEGRLKQNISVEKVIIGHDVWIGHGAIILKGIRVGNGSIIGAGSVITKNVEPYTIVAGNPAHIIKKRFNNEIIELLLRLHWWDIPESILEKYEVLFHIDYAVDVEEGINILKYILNEMKKELY